jgi:uncharacterized protein (TIGR00290 family)
MGSRKKITASWSGGKDAALALHHIIKSGEFDVENLHCVINKETGRVGLHGVRESLIQRQADAIGVPLVKSYLAPDLSNQSYEKLVLETYQSFRDQGITHILFGDIFLEDLRVYREGLLRKTGLIPVFPLWKKSSEWCVKTVITEGFRTIICAANETCFTSGILGKTIDHDLIRMLPESIDPSGENGEFHTFVFDAPYFETAIAVERGEITNQSYELKTSGSGDGPAKMNFYFQDLLLSMKDLKASNNN